MRKKEPWMRKGVRVKYGAVTGKVTSFATSNTNDGVMVHNIYVQNDGRKDSFPVNPESLDKLSGK